MGVGSDCAVASSIAVWGTHVPTPTFEVPPDGHRQRLYCHKQYSEHGEPMCPHPSLRSGLMGIGSDSAVANSTTVQGSACTCAALQFCQLGIGTSFET
jgi:hypothetical protein